MAEDYREPTEEPKVAENTEKTEKNALDEILSIPKENLIPWEKTTLPSKGVYYDGMVPNGIVEVRGWGIQTDKILATPRLAQSGQSINYVLENHVRLPNDFSHKSLLVGDRTFLLYYLRGITYGNEYEFLVECTDEECGNVWTEIYDLNLLSKTIIEPNPQLKLEPFKVSLPYFSGITNADFWVNIRLLRGYDIDTMARKKRLDKKLRPTARVRAKNRAQGKKQISKETLDQTIEQNLNMIIVDAMGDSDRRKIEELVSRMHARDTAIIREFLKDNSPGIDPSIEVVCPECDNTMTMDLPITESFFRPAVPRGLGE